MRATPAIRRDFAGSLPQEILRELVIVMSDLPAVPAVPSQVPNLQIIQNHLIEAEPEQPRGHKRVRRSGVESHNNIVEVADAKPIIKKVVRNPTALAAIAVVSLSLAPP